MDPNRTLVVYYSRTGTTRTVAHALRDELGCKAERIAEHKDRHGLLGYIRSALDAVFHRTAPLLPMEANPADHDLVVIGTPIWNASVSTPVRSFLAANRGRIPRVAFFCTCGGSGSARVFRQMEEIAGQHPVATLVLRTNEVRPGGFENAVKAFAASLSGAPARAVTTEAAPPSSVPPTPAWANR